MLVPPKYKKRLSDPGLRSTIPDRYLKALSSQLYAKRVHNRQATKSNPIYDPTAVLSGKTLHDLVSKLAGLELNPQISATQQELGLAKANDAALTGRISGYNEGVKNYMSGLVSTDAAGQRDLTTALANNTSSTLGALKSDNAADQQLTQADSDLRGQGLGGGMDQRLASDFARQMAGTQANLGAQANQSLVQAGGWTGLATIMAGASAMRGADALTQADTQGTNREAGLADKIATLKGSRGATEAKYLLDARKNEFEKAAAIQTLGIKSTQAQASLTNAQKQPESTYSKEVAKWSAKLGLTPHAFMQLGPKQRAARIKAYNDAGGGKAGKTTDQINREGLAREAASHGYTLKEWDNLSSQQRQKIAAGKAPGKKKQANGLLAPGAQSDGATDATHIAADPITIKHKTEGMGYREARDTILGSKRYSKTSLSIVLAGLDKVYLGYISEGTRKRLLADGYNPKRIAKSLAIAIGAPQVPANSPLAAYPSKQ